MTAVAVAPPPAAEREVTADRGVEDPRAAATRASQGSQEPDARRLIAEYEAALTAALGETDQIRASLAFDRADHLQDRLLRLGRTRST